MQQESIFKTDPPDKRARTSSESGAAKASEEPQECHNDGPPDISINKVAFTSGGSVGPSISASLESVISLPPAPDGGWGWMVVMGSFFAHFLCDGLAYNAGVIYEHLHETFNTGASETAWVSSVFLAVPYLLGPVSGAIVNIYGCRVATVAGAIIGFIGCTLSYFVDSLAMLCVTFGAIFGLGQGLVLFASSVIVPHYFEERRAFAYGIAVSGSGIGTAVLAPLLNTVMDEYGWRGMMLILGALSLNLTVSGLLYRPLATTAYKRRFRAKRNLEKFKKSESGAALSEQVAAINGLSEAAEQPAKQEGQLEDATNLTRSCEVAALEYKPSVLTTAMSADVIVQQNKPDAKETKVTCMRLPSPHKAVPHSRTDIFYQAEVVFTNRQNRNRAYSCPPLRRYQPKKQKWSDPIRDFGVEIGSTMRRMASVSMLGRPLYFLFWVSNVLFYMWFEVPLNYIPEYATKMTGSEYSYGLIVVIGLVTCVGQVVFGYLCDRPWMPSTLLYGMGVALMGAATLFIPLISTYFGLCIYSAIFTFFSCGNTALDTIIVTELLGIKRLTNAYGLLMVGQGLASLFGAPLAGVIIDFYGTDLHGYVVCFLHTGAWLCVSGLMVAAISPFVKRLSSINFCQCADSNSEDGNGDVESNNGGRKKTSIPKQPQAEPVKANGTGPPQERTVHVSL